MERGFKRAAGGIRGGDYVLALLTVIYALNFLDRTIFNVLIEPIKKEFALSDTTIGLLAGFGFVLFYSLLGIPIARIADRFNRRNIVAVALAFWSAMTLFCGMAQSGATLALARIGVGIGPGGTPASQAIIADLFSKNERPRALGVYAIGTYLGVFLGYFIGGYVNQHYGWRMGQSLRWRRRQAEPAGAASAIVLLTAPCFGQGVGPLAVGMLNDGLKADLGTQAVRYSLLSAAVTTTIDALLFIWAARSIRGDILRAN
ncbi:MFS transporter [Bradyrhizobium australiense]|uniref:MFS transporter n=1 Tax=Bradyrhizobium australiense TaxID=2721161 RepID=A0A7Y4GVZ4_9BRAD|nr:MFS transporter [Bradyrhizobium australiense]NOJ42668.1 MFS transporter [Bradyrhizobium australiense]